MYNNNLALDLTLSSRSLPLLMMMELLLFVVSSFYLLSRVLDLILMENEYLTVTETLSYKSALYLLLELLFPKPEIQSKKVGKLISKKGMDCLGAAESPKDYVVAGTAATEMHGCAEALWHESMEGEELFECISQTLLSGCDRNAASGKFDTFSHF